MAERKEGPNTIDTYNPFFTERRWTPFYKRHVFTGASQADQAANLITSPSFTSFWSGGGSQADLTTGVRLDSETRDVQLASGFKRRNIDYTPNIPPKPTLPTPPPHIRPIKLDTWGYPLTQNPLGKLGEHLGLGMETAQEAFEHGMFVPAKHGDIWPHMTAEEQAWWHERTRGLGKGFNYNNQVSNWQAAKSAVADIPIELRNIPSALPRDERMLVNTLHYGMDAGVGHYLVTNPNQRHADLKNFRLVNASDPSTLSGVSQELSDYVGTGKNRGRYVPLSDRHNTGIMMVSSSNPELPLNLHNSRRVLAEAGQIRLENKAILDTTDYMMQRPDIPQARPVHKVNNLHIGGKLPETPHLDVVPAVKDEFNIGTGRYREDARRVGTIVSDASRNTTMNLYGPPVKGMGAEVALNNTLHYGGKTLGAVGAVAEGLSIPLRRYLFINKIREQSGLPPLSEPYDINKFPDASSSELVQGQILGTGEAMANFISMGIWDHYAHPEWRKPIEPVQRGYYSDAGQRVPNWVPNLQSTYQRPPDTYQDRPSFEKIGARFNNMYNKGLR
jgi:hypothetical protein